jgi:membrane AbrB-like protein
MAGGLMGRWRRLGPWPSPWSIVTLALAVAAGYLAFLAHIPLAWILAPLLTTAVGAIVGMPIFAPTIGRRFGQITVGASIGLNITAAVALLILYWLPAMVLTAIISICLAAIVSVPFGFASGIDRKTAYYAMMPGGLSEMANLGAAAGAQPEPIAVSQALRVALLVCVLPPLIIALDIHGTDISSLSTPILGLWDTLLVLAIGGLGVAVARLLRFNNPWMVGALVGVGATAASGMLAGKLPLPLYWCGQFLIGISIGSRFKREVVMRLPRVFVTSAVFVLVLAALLLGYAALLSWVSGLDLASAMLGASPGGLAEMSITAQTLHLSVGLVTAFHVVRALAVNGFSTHFWNLFERIRLFDRVSQIGRIFGKD